MISTILKLLESGLSLWQHEEAQKYLEKVIDLKGQWYEEYNKEMPDDAILDNIEFELRVVSEAFSSQVGTAYTQNK
jgi:hypothetical protein